MAPSPDHVKGGGRDRDRPVERVISCAHGDDVVFVVIVVDRHDAREEASMPQPKKIVQPDDLPVRKSHSQVVTVTGGTLVFVAGMTSRSEVDASPVHPGDMRAQLRQVCENIGRALRSVGADFSDVVKTTTFTTDVDEYHRVSDERFKYFQRDLPTSALIGVRRLSHPDLMVEIEAMAVIPPAARPRRQARAR
jgi:enamine deaminase RidA (YjgF/YER057c/UK114 family)